MDWEFYKRGFNFRNKKSIIILIIKRANNDTKPDNSDNSEGETEEGDYTVYECPGLAPVRDSHLFYHNSKRISC